MEALRADERGGVPQLDGAARRRGRGRSRRIGAANVELCWEWNVKDKAGVWYPDALVPLDGALSVPNLANRVPGQKVQALYVDVSGAAQHGAGQLPRRTAHPGRGRGGPGGAAWS